MKNILIILTIALFASCSSNDEKKPEANNGYPKCFYINGVKKEIYLGSDKHEYYKNTTYNGRDVYLHYPDCVKDSGRIK